MTNKFEYEVQGCYSGSWECVTTEDTQREAIARMMEYRENAPETVYRVKKVRV